MFTFTNGFYLSLDLFVTVYFSYFKLRGAIAPGFHFRVLKLTMFLALLLLYLNINVNINIDVDTIIALVSF